MSELSDAFGSYDKSERVTHRSRRGGTTLDYMLLDSEAGRLAGEGEIWRDIARKTSDHNPVSVDFKFGVPNGVVEDRFWSRADGS